MNGDEAGIIWVLEGVRFYVGNKDVEADFCSSLLPNIVVGGFDVYPATPPINNCLLSSFLSVVAVEAPNKPPVAWPKGLGGSCCDF